MSPATEKLVEVYRGLKTNTAKWARYWVADGCPAFGPPVKGSTAPRGYSTEPMVITERLVPFRIAAAGMSEVELADFIDATKG